MASARPDTISFLTRDEVRLEGDWYQAQAPVGALLLAPAMGVPRRFYGRFAAYLATHGLSVLSFDYRGMGGSKQGPLRGYRATLDDWGLRDVTAALDTVRARQPDGPLYYLGHSIGGQLFGLLPRPQVDAAVFVAAQSGWFGNWSGWPKLAMATFWHTVPVLTAVTGKLPMRALGQGEDVPAGVARQWAHWGRHRDYLMRDYKTRPQAFATFSGAIRSYSFDDDGYAPKASVAALLDWYQQAQKEHRHLEPAMLGLPSLGHFEPFKPSFEASFWRDVRDWLLAQRLTRAA